MPERPPRRPGSPWRLLVHQWLGRKGDLPYGTAYHVTNRPADVAAHDRATAELGLDPSLSEHTLIEGTEFDELVVGRWLHIEQMDTSMWWMTIGGVVIHVWADRDGRPTHVTVHGPGCYDLPAPGCEYELDWHEEARHG